MTSGKYVTWKNNDDFLVESQSSIEIKKTTRGVTFTVKVYNSDPYDALEAANTIFDKCKKKYSEENNDTK